MDGFTWIKEFRLKGASEGKVTRTTFETREEREKTVGKLWEEIQWQ